MLELVDYQQKVINFLDSLNMFCGYTNIDVNELWLY